MKNDIIHRLEKLESENRRMKQVGIVAVVIVSAFIVGGQAKSNKIVEANEFHLVDPAGKVRAEIFFPPGSTDAKLLFRDADGITDCPSRKSYPARRPLKSATFKKMKMRCG